VASDLRLWRVHLLNHPAGRIESAVSAASSKTSLSLTGWGRTSPSVAQVLNVNTAGVADALQQVSERGVLARGLGRAYGDSAQNGGGLVLRLEDSAQLAVIDQARDEVTVGAGSSIDELLKVLVPRGYFVPVTPGTRFVTIGGAIASDIHGKNHHGEGSFGNHVRRMSLLLADGSTVELSPTVRPELFWATLGGMGLTGIVLDATFALLPIETNLCRVDTVRANNLDHVLSLMEEGDSRYRYSVAWVDMLSRGKNFGRSVLTSGDHATLDDLAAVGIQQPKAYEPKVLAHVPSFIPNGLINKLTSQAFNEVWFRKAPKSGLGELHSIANFFHPLDMVGSWNRLYGRRGFIQYQFVVPFEQVGVLRQIVERVVASRAASPVVVLKRFGVSNSAPLSFPSPGWTLTVDIPAAFDGLGALLHGLDHMVLEAGGRHYLAKDSHTTPEAIKAGYPRLAEWRAIRDQADPTGVWRSDQARRLGLVD
jgi:decaprenylphospho-beta-D-ribofuranose 2-oxidase